MLVHPSSALFSSLIDKGTRAHVKNLIKSIQNKVLCGSPGPLKSLSQLKELVSSKNGICEHMHRSLPGYCVHATCSSIPFFLKFFELASLYWHKVPDGKSELIPKICSGFGGGIGLCGSVCGSLTGSIMAVGIKYGSNEAGEGNNVKAYAKANTLYHLFEKEHGTVLCRELIKYDLSKPEQVAKARQEGFLKKCVPSLSKLLSKTFLK